MHPQFQQLLWIAGFMTAAPFLFGAAALLFGAARGPSEGTPTGEASLIDEEKLRD
jgi:hypothetical protein